MQAIVPGIYAHADQMREALRYTGKGTSMIAVLMNAFFTKETLKNATLCPGGKGKQLDPEIVEAILGKFLRSLNPETKLLPFCRHFSNAWQWDSVGFDSGLALIRYQAMNWTNINMVHRPICAWLGSIELILFVCTSWARMCDGPLS